MSTVVALATPWGHAALAVVRLSGPSCHHLVRQLCEPLRPSPLRAGAPRRVRLLDGDGVYDDGVAWLGSAPRTYTGEDTAEITLHGNPVLVRRLLSAAVQAGARLASPGEFTRRAVLHGKLDLVAAEGVLQAASATTHRGAEVARAALDGSLGEHLALLRRAVVQVNAELEARLDYPADELALEGDDALLESLAQTERELLALARTFDAGRVLVQGARVALVGAVNAGKSSLFNALLGRSRALVHERPGTTRDVLEVATVVEGVQITLLDTAGERPTDDPVEAAGLALARELVGEADLLLLVLRARPEGLSDAERALLDRTADRHRLVVLNGVDVAHAPPQLELLRTCALSGQGVAKLGRALVHALVGTEPGHAGHVIAAAWQRDALLEASRCVAESAEAMPVAGVAVSADALTRALEALDSLTGADTREDVLDALFARFCIGK